MRRVYIQWPQISPKRHSCEFVYKIKYYYYY